MSRSPSLRALRRRTEVHSRERSGDNRVVSEDFPSPQWLWSDAWVLSAIMITDKDGGSTLTEVVAAADAINHAILMDSEVEPAVRRLLGAGLISTLPGRFLLTDTGRAMAAAKRGGMLSQVDSLLRMLQRLPATEQEWSLQPGELRRAADEWNERAERFLARHRKTTGRGNAPGTP